MSDAPKPLRWLALALVVACGGDGSSPARTESRLTPLGACGPQTEPLRLTGTVATSDAKTYRLLPFEVGAGTTRIEIGYRWSETLGLPPTPVTQTVLDLGVWDADGYRSAAGFRGWSGSRQGRLHEGQEPVFIAAAVAERGYRPGPIEAGVWTVELGVGSVGPIGADWEVRIDCLGGAPGVPPAADPVDASHVARDGPAWFHGDFHMHGFHSNPRGPAMDDFVAQARAAELDFLMVTEYVTGRHWDELGAMQRAHPDLLVWPGREIITYYGHANTHGETPDVVEYRHGFEDVRLGDIQRAAKAAGALFQVNHPTIFPGPLFENFCRGCEFELGGEIDWSAVDTIEVVTGPILTRSSELGLPDLGLEIQNPFVQPAIDLWESLLARGFRITAVSGSDSKGVDDVGERPRVGYGSSATAVFADELSRPALTRAIRDGRAYVRTRGVERSPALEMSVEAASGETGTFGDTFSAESARLRVTVRGGAGQRLRYLRNGKTVLVETISADSFEHELIVERVPSGEGPLGTFWRIETADDRSITTIANPVFLTGGSTSRTSRRPE
ncbi:MAG: CehA/McbA family metallohydrolase [Candidatus Binatia bacterium]